MQLSESSAMQKVGTSHDIESGKEITHQISPLPGSRTLDAIAALPSRSSTNSPTSQKTAVDSTTSQATQSDRLTVNRDLTPPSSVDSSHEQTTIIPRDEHAISVAGRKRTADGEVKCVSSDAQRAPLYPGQDETFAYPGDVGELSRSLKMKLSYAMVKIQNGWQDRSLDEIESLASQSPRSVVSGPGRVDRALASSPGTALATTPITLYDTTCKTPGRTTFTSGPVRSSRKILAPSASFTSGHRRRSTVNGGIQINVKRSPPAIRPTVRQRTASQNAAMEADAVETLLFMSGSPNNSGRFPSTFSPISQTFSTQTSPLRGQFSPRSQRPFEERDAIADRLLCDMDDDTNDELNAAVQIMERHRASKLTV